MAFITKCLDGIWQFKEYPTDARNISDLDCQPWHSASVPGSIFECLQDANLLKMREVLVKPRDYDWISHKPWIFSKTFECDTAFLATDKIDLVFDCLDTVATIWLNEKIIARSSSMFMPCRIAAKQFLRMGQNRILVKFDPALAYAQKQYEKLGRGNMQVESFIRKPLIHFPADANSMPTGCGILSSCRLESTNKARIEHVHVRTVDASAHFADLRIALKITGDFDEQYSCRITISAGTFKISNELVFQQGQEFQSTLFRIDRPFLWWPRGHGIQFLYDLKIELIHNETVLDSVSRPLGLRTVKLNTSDPASGSVFEVNGRSIYIKGAAWNALSHESARISQTQYKHMLGLALQSNLNMLRVSGFGGYETPEFYDLCDKLGLMVWQDFAITNPNYPDKPAFTQQIEQEVAAKVTQLRNHPCVVVFSSCADSPQQIKTARPNKLFSSQLTRIISELDPSAAYIDNSANSPVFKSVFDLHRQAPPAFDYFSSPVSEPAFLSAWGFASPPDIKNIEKHFVLDRRDLSLAQFESLAGQKVYLSRLYQYAGEIFGLCKKPADLSLRSALVAARFAKFHAEALRCGGKNAGQILWFFNDHCTSIGFGAIDFDRSPKPLYHYMRRFFAPVMITAITRNDHALGPAIEVIAVNDTASPITANIIATLMDISGKVKDKTSLPVSISPFSVSAPFKLPKAIAMPDELHDSVLHLAMQNDDKFLAQNTFLYTPDKFINYPRCDISQKLEHIDEVTYRLHLSAPAFVKDLFIEIPWALHIWDNFLDLVPSIPQSINITVAKSAILDQSQITLTHL